MPKRKRPVLGLDYKIDPDGKAEFTPEFLLKRGYCCEHDCRYCPFLTTSASQSGENQPMCDDQHSASTSVAMLVR